MPQQLIAIKARTVYWIAEQAIFLGQRIIRIAYRWRAWAERQQHLASLQIRT